MTQISAMMHKSASSLAAVEIGGQTEFDSRTASCCKSGATTWRETCGRQTRISPSTPSSPNDRVPYGSRRSPCRRGGETVVGRTVRDAPLSPRRRRTYRSLYRHPGRSRPRRTVRRDRGARTSARSRLPHLGAATAQAKVLASAPHESAQAPSSVSIASRTSPSRSPNARMM